MTLNNKKELFVYNKYIKSYVQEDEGSLVMDADIFVKTYTSMKNEKLKNVYVNCLNKTNIKLINNTNILKFPTNIELTEEEDVIDDYSPIDEFIEQEIISKYHRNVLNDDNELDNTFYVNNQFVDSLICTSLDKQYIKGYIDGRNFELSDGNNHKAKEQVLYTESIIDKKRNKELRDRLIEIMEVLNSVEREVIRLFFSENLSIKQISMLLNLTEKSVDVIYNKALIKIKNNKRVDELKKLMK